MGNMTELDVSMIHKRIAWYMKETSCGENGKELERHTILRRTHFSMRAASGRMSMTAMEPNMI